MSESSKVIYQGTHCPPDLKKSHTKPSPHRFIELAEKKVRFCEKCGLTFTTPETILFAGISCAGERYEHLGLDYFGFHNFEYSERIAFCNKCGLTIKY